MKRTRKYILRSLLGLFGLLCIFWIGMYVFFLLKKEDIRSELSKEITQAVRGECLIRDLGLNVLSLFPNISLSLKGVEMRDSTWQLHHQSFLKADKILFRINPFSLITGKLHISKIVIENAVIRSFVDSSGYTNEYLLSPRTRSKQKTKEGFHLDEIALKNVRFIRSDKLKDKLYDFDFRKLKIELHHHDEDYRAEIKMDGFIHALTFNGAKGSYAREKPISGNFWVSFTGASQELSFQKIRLAIDHQYYNFTGAFRFNQEKSFRLEIVSDKVNYAKALELLPEKLARKLSDYNINHSFRLSVVISGPMIYKSLPKVVANARITNSLVHTPAGDFTDLTTNGTFSNAMVDSLPFTDENSALVFTDLKTKWEGIPISSRKVIISNLTTPFLKCDIAASASLSSLNNLLNSESLDFTAGEAKAEISYAGALMSDTTTTVDGNVTLIDGSMIYEPRRLHLDKINGKFFFQNADVYIKDLHADAQGNKIRINAMIRNMLNLLMKDPAKLFVDADIYSPSIDLYAFRTMLGARKKRAVSRKGKFARLAQNIDHFMDVCSISTRLKAGKLKYKNFVANDLEAAFSMNSDRWNLQKIAFQSADGGIELNGTLTSLRDNDNAVEVDTRLLGINIAKLFAAFNNFGLSSLHADNIRGKLTSRMHLHAILDNESRLIPATLNGTIDLSLKDGELNNFDPLQKLAVFVLKKRDFSHLAFAELKNNFIVHSSMITIHRMEIQSSILGLFVEGIYDVKGKNTDLVVQVPIKYLKKRAPDYIPENHGLDARKGISVFVRAKSGDHGDIDFKYGLFRKKSVLEKAEREHEREAKKTTPPLQP